MLLFFVLWITFVDLKIALLLFLVMFVATQQLPVIRMLQQLARYLETGWNCSTKYTASALLA
jgi:hypothetical protein